MKSLLFILPGFTTGGTVFSTLNMISLLCKEGYKVSVLAMTHQGTAKCAYSQFNILDEKFWISIISGATNKEHGYRRIASITVKLASKLLKHFNIDIKRFIYRKAASDLQRHQHFDIVVACQEGSATQFVSYFSNAKRIAWVRCEYSSYKSMVTEEKYLEELRHIYPSYDNIVCVSATTRMDFLRYFANLENRVLAIHNIQDIESIEKKGDECIPETFPDNSFMIVSIGRIAPQKRFHKIPEIANIMKDKGISFNWYIIGDGNVDGEGDKLTHNIETYQCQDYVILLGHKQNPYPYIKRADLLVNTSYTEACPRVLAEARILNTPVVCADFKSATEFVDNGENGYIGTIDELPSIIGELITNEECYSRIKQASNSNSQAEENAIIMTQLKSLFA